MVDTTSADANTTKLTKITFGCSWQGKPKLKPLDSRFGLVLVCATGVWPHELRVCCPATGRSQTLPPEPPIPRVGSDDVQYVLLVGDGDVSGSSDVGRPFQVLKVKELPAYYSSERRLLIQTFSSEHGTWSPKAKEVSPPNLHGDKRWWPLKPRPLVVGNVVHWLCVTDGRSSPGPLKPRPLVVGNVVHWLCVTDGRSYVTMLHVSSAATAAARVNTTTLPESFPRGERVGYLLVTSSAGGNPSVLVADGERISVWEQSKHTKMWKQRPEVVIENEAVREWVKDDRRRRWTKFFNRAMLVWFAERSGVVLIQISTYGLIWLDLQSKEIIRCFSGPRIEYSTTYCPYEVDFKSWVPSFNSTRTF